MPCSEQHYPASMKHLTEEVRQKAIEIANALLEENYEEGRAIAIATAKAEQWAERRHKPVKEQPDFSFVVVSPQCPKGQYWLVELLTALLSEVIESQPVEQTPVWVFHGALDDVGTLQQLEIMVEALKACGGNVRFTVYPDAGHDS